MHKLKSPILLASVQAIVAAVLLSLAGPAGPDPSIFRFICFGLNAPAQVFRFLDPTAWGPAFDFLPRSVLGFDTSYFFFLAGVFLLWYFVGRAIQRPRDSATLDYEGNRKALSLVSSGLLLVLGIGLLALAIQALNRFSASTRIVYAILTFLWATVLIFASTKTIIQTSRRRIKGTDDPRS